MNHLFCLGLGYSAGVLAHRLTTQGWTITGTSTSEVGAQNIAGCGYRGVVFNGREKSEVTTQALGIATHILLSVPPGAQGDPALRLHGDDIAASRSIRWIGYFSTVGVYGDSDGQWVSEDTVATPASERGQRRLEAENGWRALGQQSGKTTVVFRLPGIYGPGRSTIDDVRDGTARRIIKPGQVFNRIHVDDIASAVEASIRNPIPNRVYNVTDDEPGPPQDVVAFAAELLGQPVPPGLDFATTELSPMARSFYSESKRVSNARLKSELGLQLAYPTYREGLSAIAHRPLPKV
jgi:dTDP-4-dehydrorhamnose reductase